MHLVALAPQHRRVQLSGARIVFDDQNVMLAGHGISASPVAYTRSRLDFKRIDT
jgi:hypothetical protein